MYEGTRVCLETNKVQSVSGAFKKLQLILMGENLV